MKQHVIIHTHKTWNKIEQHNTTENKIKDNIIENKTQKQHEINDNKQVSIVFNNQ